ncbi:MAG: hypothetical protein WC803_07475 [Sphingomonas sp.]
MAVLFLPSAPTLIGYAITISWHAIARLAGGATFLNSLSQRINACALNH